MAGLHQTLFATLKKMSRDQTHDLRYQNMRSHQSALVGDDILF